MVCYKGNKIGQGKENVKKFLKENPSISEEIDIEVRKKAGLSVRKQNKIEEKSTDKSTDNDKKKKN